jgi:hypothetical protein
MLEDMYAPHLINERGLTERVTEHEYKSRTGEPRRTVEKREKKKKR